MFRSAALQFLAVESSPIGGISARVKLLPMCGIAQKTPPLKSHRHTSGVCCGQQKRRTMELESLLQAHMDVCIAIAVFSRTTKLDPLDILSQGQR